MSATPSLKASSNDKAGMKPFSTDEERVERAELIRILRETPPETLLAMSEMQTVEAFHRVAQSVPFYQQMLSSNGVDPSTVTDIQSYCAQAPILDKHNTFAAHSISELCTGGNLDDIRTLLTSSGHSGVFSFGVNTKDNLQRSAKSIDMGLQYLFDVDNRATVLINCLPMGVKVNTTATFLAETSVRDDMVFAIVKKFSEEFDQVILVGEGSFIKKIIEDGAEQHGIDWPSLRVHLITGEEGIAENYRTYIAKLLGIDDITAEGGKLVGSSMGVAELDLNIFHETRESIEIRRLAHQDEKLRKALFGGDVDFCPMFFAYYPQRCYVEEMPRGDGHNELVISMLSEEMKIPLLRYKSGDIGRIMTYDHVVDTLREHGYDLKPDLQLPFVAVYGRGKSLDTPQGHLFPEAVKEALYADHDIAAAITGNFHLTDGGDGGQLAVQLRRGFDKPAEAEARLLKHLASYSSVTPEVTFGPYETFGHAMEVDYERKFSYV